MNTDRFKFRVWDKKNSEYVPEGKMCDVHCLLHRDGTLDCGVSYDDGYAGGIDWVETYDAVIEQCTGLKDRKGNLIYEGDVLNVEDYDGFHTMIVAWHDEASCLSLLKQKAGKYVPIWRHLVAFVSDELEIIGNIHEMEVTKCNLE